MAWYKYIFVNTGAALSGTGNETIGVPHTFTSPGSDVYLFSLVGIAHTQPFHLTLTGVNTSMGITHSNSWDDFETFHRNVMLGIDKKQVVQLKVKGAPAFGGGSSWGGFSVSGYMDPLVAFSVARTTSMTSPGLVRYDTEIVNTGQFNMGTSTFTSPAGGIYYFSLTVGLFTSGTVSLFLRVNNINMYNLFHNSSTSRGVETMSGTTLLELLVDDQVSLHLMEGPIYSTSEEVDISMSGFLYSPKTVSPVAWLVSKTNSDITVLNHSMRYDQAHILKDVKFTNTDTVEIPFTGVYYIHLSVAVPAGKEDVKLRLNYNNQTKNRLIVFSYSDSRQGSRIVGGSVILPLVGGAKLTIKPITSNIDTFESIYRATSFLGFLLKLGI